MRHNIPILLIEDDRIDVKNVERAFRENSVTNPLYHAKNGEEGLAFLRNESPFADPQSAPRPGLILLDLNLPVMNGLDFLETYRNDPELRSIPSVVLTTSDEERDRLRSYAIGIAGYIVKPVDFSSFVKAMRQLDQYWSICELPSN